MHKSIFRLTVHFVPPFPCLITTTIYTLFAVTAKPNNEQKKNDLCMECTKFIFFIITASDNRIEINEMKLRTMRNPTRQSRVTNYCYQIRYFAGRVKNIVRIFFVSRLN